MIQIPLTQGQVAFIDDEDAHLAAFEWHVVLCKRKAYARRTLPDSGNRKVYLHREVMKAARDVRVDHKDGNTLDCRRDNLRTATHGQNMRNAKRRTDNTSGYKGVTYRSDVPTPWRARIRVEGKELALGFFPTAEAAARAYDDAARRHHGEFARLNFPTEGAC